MRTQSKTNQKAREDAGDQVVIWIWLVEKVLRVFFGPITEWSKSKPTQSQETFDTQLNIARILYDSSSNQRQTLNQSLTKRFSVLKPGCEFCLYYDNLFQLLRFAFAALNKEIYFFCKEKKIMALGNQQPEIYKTMVQHLGKKLRVFQTKLLADRN